MLNNSNTLQKKFLISLLIVTLTCSNFMLVGSNICKGLISYALDNSEIEQNNEVEEDNEIICEVSVESTDIHKTKMQETTNFTENLNLHLKNVSNISIEDAENAFYNNEEEVVENANLKYGKTAIKLEDLKNLLGNEGILEVSDNQDNKIAVISLETIKELEEMANKIKEDENVEALINAPQTFIKVVEVQDEEGNNVEEEQEEIRSYLNIVEDKLEITYVLEVKEIKLKIENINLLTKNEENENVVNEVNFVIENTKSIFDVENLESLNYLKENKIYNFNKIEEAEESTEQNEETQNIEEENNQIENIVKFKNTITRAKLEADNTTWELGELNKVNYKIVLDTTAEKAELYKNPIFIVELPEVVESVNTSNSEFTVENDGGVFTEKEVSVITILGRKYALIRLTGEQTSESVANGNAVINLSLELNLKNSEDQTQNTKLYYQNGIVTAYESKVGFGTEEISITLIQKNEEIARSMEMTQENPELETSLEEGETQPSNITTNFLEGKIDLTGDPKVARVGEEFEYIIDVYKHDDIGENTIIEDVIPNGLEYVDAKLYLYNEEEGRYTTEFNKEGALRYNPDLKTIIVDFNLLENSKTVLKIKVKATSLADGEYIKDINNQVKVLVNGENTETIDLQVKVSDAFLEITKVDAVEKAKLEDAITYVINIKNPGLFVKGEQTVKIKIPEELKPGTISVDDEYTVSMIGNEDEISIYLGAEDTVVVKVTALYIAAVQNNKYVTATVSVGDSNVEWTTKLLRVGNYGEDVEEGDDDDLNNPGTPNNPTDPTNPNEPVNPENPTNPNDPVNPENPNDPTNPENPTDPTNPNNPTDPTDPENPNDPSDPTNPEKPGEENTEKPEFDLSLAQSIKKITVTNAKGTTVYEYKDANFAKIEIHSKQMNGSTVTIEYEVTVKNEGTIAGYARKIVDYIPSGLTFNSELNKDWYVGQDGNLYSVALIDKELQPEDTATLKLVLTKQMSNENGGTVANVAEIYEATNDANEPDINSTPGDKKDNQNDMAKAEVLITVATGTIILYTMLAITVLAILVYGTVKVKNITLKKEGK